MDFDLAKREFQRALELNPNYPQARAWYGLFFLQWIAGREQEGRDELLRLLQVDPLSGYANVILAFSGISSGRLSEAVEHGRKGVELDPNSYLAHWSFAAALACNAQYEEAAAMAERALAISGRHSWALMSLVSIYAAWDKPDNARAAYRELEARSAREYIQPSMLAPAAAAVGEMDRAIAFAQQALDDKDPLFVMQVPEDVSRQGIQAHRLHLLHSVAPVLARHTRAVHVSRDNLKRFCRRAENARSATRMYEQTLRSLS